MCGFLYSGTNSKVFEKTNLFLCFNVIFKLPLRHESKGSNNI